ncbi:uncharacterized protein G2W53_041856 [Senna tora]|uniref:Uncharacterized protein n=1 Tax=Senna tora TaxID=362788 RepID=A0A834VZH8_9FABA|nr:uncharacterized protein G2W53_041856 [Senna tora]
MGEENISMKYKKDETLLVCKTTTCHLMVHENYLGAPAQLVAEDPNSSQKLVARDKTIVDAVNGYGAKHNNMIDFVDKHHEFLSSLYVSRTDFTTSTEMGEENIFMNSAARCSIVSPRKQLWENPTSADLNSSQKLVASNETIADVVNGCGVEQNNKIDFADKNHEILSSLYMSRTYFTASIEMGEENLCMNSPARCSSLTKEDLNSSQKLVASDETIADVVNGCGVEHNNMIDFADKNHEILSSLYMFRTYFTASIEMGEENLCMNSPTRCSSLTKEVNGCDVEHNNMIDFADKNQEILSSLYMSRTYFTANLNSSQKLVASDETIADVVNGCGVEHNNMIDFADKNHEILNSLYMSRTYFTASSEMGEENLWMKY